MTRRPPFFWCVLSIGVVFLLFFGFGAYTAIRHLGKDKYFGYFLERRSGGLFVSRVFAGGPADGKLQTGDRVLAIAGDERAVVTVLLGGAGLRAGETYSVRVARGGAEREYHLTFRTVPAPAHGPEIFACFLAALYSYAMALLLGFAKPQDGTARAAWLFLMANAVHTVRMGLEINFGALEGIELKAFGILALASYFSVPTGYRCASMFPTRIPEARSWRALKALVWAVGIAWWLMLVPFSVCWLLDGRSRVAFYVFARPLFEFFGGLYGSTYFVPTIVVSVAVPAVLLRNYLRLRQPDQRRRIRFVVFAVIAAVLPGLVIAAGTLLFYRTGFGFDPRTPRMMAVERIFGSASTGVIMPLAAAYAILKHRMLGIHLVVRKGLQYLLARRVLEALLLLPVLALIGRIVLHPDLTIANLLFGGWLWVVLIAVSALGLRFRRQLILALDRRFFREAYNREQILSALIERVPSCVSAGELAELACGEIDAAIHPTHAFLLYRPADREGGEVLQSIERSPRAHSVSDVRGLSGAASRWLRETGVELLVPIPGTGGRNLGALLLGPKKSEEPYASGDRSLLEAVAAQLGIVYENLSLKESVDRERQTRREVLARVEQAGISLLRECPKCGVCYDPGVEQCGDDGSEPVLTLPVERVIENKYRLDRRIGAGAMGAVYQAWDMRLGRAIALKVMTGGLFGNQPALRRFEREAQAAARLNHPNIVAVYDFGVLGGDGAYIVMELVPGASLRVELDASGRVPPAQAAVWFDQLLSGLAAAHQAGVIHRDLKPANILVAGTALKIADFGLARLEAPEDGENMLTRAGTVLGTLGYMAPEQLRGEPADERSDLFSVGVMAVEAVAGRRPFASRSTPELLSALAAPPRLLPGPGPNIARLNGILARCLDLNPALRPASAEELRSELIDALRLCPPLALSAAVPDASAETETGA